MSYTHFFSYGEMLANRFNTDEVRSIEEKIARAEHELDTLKNTIRTEWFFEFCERHTVTAIPEDGTVMAYFGKSIEIGVYNDVITSGFYLVGENGTEEKIAIEDAFLMENACMGFANENIRGYICIENWDELLATPGTC